ADDLAVLEHTRLTDHELGIGADGDRAALEAAFDLDARIVGKHDHGAADHVAGAEVVFARAARTLGQGSTREKTRNLAVGDALRAVAGQAGVEPRRVDFLDDDSRPDEPPDLRAGQLGALQIAAREDRVPDVHLR